MAQVVSATHQTVLNGLRLSSHVCAHGMAGNARRWTGVSNQSLNLTDFHYQSQSFNWESTGSKLLVVAAIVTWCRV